MLKQFHRPTTVYQIESPDVISRVSELLRYEGLENDEQSEVPEAYWAQNMRIEFQSMTIQTDFSYG